MLQVQSRSVLNTFYFVLFFNDHPLYMQVSSGNSRYQSASPPVPVNKECCHPKVPQAGYPFTQVRPILKTFKGGDTAANVAPCSMEAVTFNSEDDSDDCYTTTSTTLSSFPSPEIFRGENTGVYIFMSKKRIRTLHPREVCFIFNILCFHSGKADFPHEGGVARSP